MMGELAKVLLQRSRSREEAENVFIARRLQKRQATKFMPLTDATLKGKLDITGADPSHELIY